jgi:serine/threonine protein kinase
MLTKYNILQIKTNLKLVYIYCNRIYGVTRDPQSGECAIVTKLKNGGNLREMIKKNHSNLTWNKIIQVLFDISYGLREIHNQNYHHKDFHSGNILNELTDFSINSVISDFSINSVISDFGLCCPANQSSADKTLYGVLPFVAPEEQTAYAGS